MAGRPKTRAKRLAAEAALRSAVFPDEMPQIQSYHGTQPAPPVTVDEPAPPKDDREQLSDWWRNQVELIERTSAERADLLRDAGEHPNPIFARQAKVFGALGIPRDVVAVLLGISEGELSLHYGNEYAVGSAEVVSQVAANLLRIATSQNDRVAVKAAIEVMNRRGGEEWHPPAQKLEIDDSRKAKGNLIDSSKLSYEERQQLRAIVERAVGRRVDGEAVGGVVPQIESEEGEEA